jgi:threonine/homoserine/homoserine lactone efflux protein
VTLPLAPFLTVWAVLAMNIASPGPNVLNTIASALGSGRKAGLASAAGVAVGIGLWCLGMTLGMAAVFQAVPVARTALTLLAIGLLLWFSGRYLRAALAGWQGGAGPVTGRSGLGMRASFTRSLVVNAMNPKALTTWVVILSLFPAAEARAGDIAVLGLGAATLAFSIHAGYALAFSTAPAARLWARLAPAISAAVGLFFAGFAARLALGLAAG